MISEETEDIKEENSKKVEKAGLSTCKRRP